MTTAVHANIGLDAKATEKSVAILMQYLSDVFFLYMKTHSFHINITGFHFYTLHEMLEEQYKSLFESIDEVAERIRAVGAHVPLNYAQLRAHSKITEVTDIPDEGGMLKALCQDHEAVIQKLRVNIETLNATDVGSGDFLTGQIQEHEKMAWMLRSHFC